MTVPSPDRVVFQPVVKPNRGRQAWLWGPTFDAPGDAKAWGKAKYDAGECTMSFVVRITGTQKRVLATGTYPETLRKLIHHWIQLNVMLGVPPTSIDEEK